MRIFLDQICLGFSALPIFGVPLCLGSSFVISLNTSYNSASLSMPLGIPIILMLDFGSVIQLLDSCFFWGGGRLYSDSLHMSD